MARSAVLAGLALLALIHASAAISFDVQTGHVKCFKEEMSKKQLVTGTYEIANSHTMAMRFWVRLSELVTKLHSPRPVPIHQTNAIFVNTDRGCK